jgi:methionyl-tRNA formyltransferase
MKFVVIGTSEFTISNAKGIIDSDHELSLVVSLSPKLLPDNSVDLGSFCAKNNISFLEVEDINAYNLIQELRNKKPDYIFSSWPRILQNNILDIPKYFVIGTHPTLLPMNKGRHPVQWMIVLGIQYTSLSFFAMDEGIDSGRILLQVPFPVGKRTINEVNSNMNQCGYEGTRKLIQIFEKSKNYIGCEQLPDFQNYWRKRNEHDITLDPRMSLEMLIKVTNSFVIPYPGARLWIAPDIYLTILEVKKAHEKDYPPNWFNYEHGYIFSTREDYLVMRVEDDVAEISPIEEKHIWKNLYKTKIYPPTFYLQKKYASV